MEFFEIKDKRIDIVEIKNKIMNKYNQTGTQSEESKLQKMQYDVLLLKSEDENLLYDLYLKKKELQKTQYPCFLPEKFYFINKLRFKLTRLFSKDTIKNQNIFNETLTQKIENILKKSSRPLNKNL